MYLRVVSRQRTRATSVTAVDARGEHKAAYISCNVAGPIIPHTAVNLYAIHASGMTQH